MSPVLILEERSEVLHIKPFSYDHMNQGRISIFNYADYDCLSFTSVALYIYLLDPTQKNQWFHQHFSWFSVWV